MTMKTERLGYIDAMRGFCMVLVVYWHLSMFGASDLALNPLFFSFQLPLFFFISGFFAYNQQFTPPLLLKNIKNRLLKQLLPTLVVGSLFLLYNSFDFLFILSDINKAGYWFTIVAVEIYLLYAIPTFIVDSFKPQLRPWLFAGMIMLFGALSFIGHRWDGSILYQSLSFYRVLKYMPYFMCGVLARMYFSQFERLIRNTGFMSIMIASYVIIFNISGKLSTALCGYLGVIIVFGGFYHFRSIFEKDNMFARSMQYVGTKTLSIYLLHYFILDGVVGFKDFAIEVSKNGGWLSGMIVFMLLSFVVIAMCLFIENFLDRIASPLHRLMFGL